MGIRRVLRLRAALKRTSALGILSALALPLPAAAQSIWGGSGSTSATTDYNTATNWSNPPGVAPISAGTSAVFANSGPGTVNVSAAVSPNSWTFATNAQSYTITGANVTFNTGTGLIDNANAGQSISIDNSLGGAGGIQLNGNSTLTLTTINTYTGATTINPGATLALSGLGGIPFSSVVTANGTFDISGSAIPFKAISTLAGSGFVQLGNNGLVITAGSTEFSGTIAGTGSGGIEIAGGTQTLSGVNTYAGVTQIDPGATLALKGNGSIANTLYVGFLGAGTLDISQTKSGASVSGLFDPVGFGKVSLGSKTLTFTGSAGFFNGVIQDGGIGGGTGGNVTIANGGLATLGGVNTALTQLDGEAGTGAERAAFQLTDQFLTLMLDPFVDGRQGRLGSGGGGAIGFAPEQQENLPPDIALAYAAIPQKGAAADVRPSAGPPGGHSFRWRATRANGDAELSALDQPSPRKPSALRQGWTIASRRTPSQASRSPAPAPIGGSPARSAPEEATRRRSALTPSPVSGARPTSPVRSPSPTTGLRPIARRWALRFQPTSSARAMGRGWKAVGASACCRRLASRRMGPCRRRISIRRPIARATRPAVVCSRL